MEWLLTTRFAVKVRPIILFSVFRFRGISNHWQASERGLQAILVSLFQLFTEASVDLGLRCGFFRWIPQLEVAGVNREERHDFRATYTARPW